VHGALSSHCVLPGPEWSERSLAHYTDPTVAGTNGAATTPDGRSPLREPVRQTAAIARAYPDWGFSNHASTWRASVWRELPFSESMPTVEDKEWALRVLDAGHVLVYDPALWVEMGHRWRQGTVNYFRRERVEQRILGTLYELPPYGAGDLVREWWTPPDDRHGALFHRLNYRRMAGLLAKHQGRRAARRARAG
jgi:rhamnosyltransferase